MNNGNCEPYEHLSNLNFIKIMYNINIMIIMNITNIMNIMINMTIMNSKSYEPQKHIKQIVK